MRTYWPEQDNELFWNRIQTMPVDTEESLLEFWELIHEPDNQCDDAVLEYNEREHRWWLTTPEGIVYLLKKQYNNDSDK